MEAINNFLRDVLIARYSGSRNNGTLSEGFQYYMEFPLDGDTIEVPLFSKEVAVKSKLDGYANLVVPLVASPQFRERRQASRMLKDFYSQRGICDLTGVRSTKGDKYYGMPGFICDDKMHLLFLSTCVIDVTGGRGWVTKINIYLDYDMLENSDRILEKTFLRQYIPNIRQTKVAPHFLIEGTLIKEDPSIQEYPSVIIEDINSKFIISPRAPIPGSNFEQKINENFKQLINGL